MSKLPEKIKKKLKKYMEQHYRPEDSQDVTYWKNQFLSYLKEKYCIVPLPGSFEAKDLRDPIRNHINSQKPKEANPADKEENDEPGDPHGLSPVSKLIKKQTQKPHIDNSKKEVTPQKPGSVAPVTTPGKELTTPGNVATTPGNSPGKYQDEDKQESGEDSIIKTMVEDPPGNQIA